MDRLAFDLMAAAEERHWWFHGRRDIIAAAMRTLGLPPDARVLDAGCGSGGNLRLLHEFGDLYAFEYDYVARAAAAALQIAKVERGALPDTIPFPGITFDAIGLFDVLEHLEHSVASLRSLGERLAPGGALVITTPALPLLWGPHDVHHQHFRRYTRASLVQHIRDAGLVVEYVSYFNTLLLPLAVLQRIRERLFGYSATDLIPGPRLNSLLYRIFSVERAWIPARRAPVGLSLLAVVRRAGATSV
jgi:SAM-dependent methyltransferase